MESKEIVNQFYQLNNDAAAKRASADSFRPLFAENLIFKGPAIMIEGADKYVELLRQFLNFHESLEVVKQFVDGDDVCSMTKLKLRSPSGKSVELEIAEWCVVRSGKIASHTIYYDPREFMSAFPM